MEILSFGPIEKLGGIPKSPRKPINRDVPSGVVDRVIMDSNKTQNQMKPLRHWVFIKCSMLCLLVQNGYYRVFAYGDVVCGGQALHHSAFSGECAWAYDTGIINIFAVVVKT